MHERTREEWLQAEAPAKLNLFLEILGRRADGYHELETVMHAVDLCDTVRVRAEGTEITVSCPDGGAPEGPENIVHKAASVLRETAGVSSGVRIEVAKKIPAGAGLGGGSSDAATALRLLNDAWGTGLSAAELAVLGARVGSDVPFFLVSTGTALCRGRGERVEDLPLRHRFHFVLIWPRMVLSTRRVYEALGLRGQGRELTGATRSATLSADALISGDTALLGTSLFNRLEPAAFAIAAELTSLKKEVKKLCPCGAQMTGSGSAVFGICRDRAEAERSRDELQHAGLAFAVSSHRMV